MDLTTIVKEKGSRYSPRLVLLFGDTIDIFSMAQSILQYQRFPLYYLGHNSNLHVPNGFSHIWSHLLAAQSRHFPIQILRSDRKHQPIGVQQQMNPFFILFLHMLPYFIVI